MFKISSSPSTQVSDVLALDKWAFSWVQATALLKIKQIEKFMNMFSIDNIVITTFKNSVDYTFGRQPCDLDFSTSARGGVVQVAWEFPKHATLQAMPAASVLSRVQGWRMGQSCPVLPPSFLNEIFKWAIGGGGWSTTHIQSWPVLSGERGL